MLCLVENIWIFFLVLGIGFLFGALCAVVLYLAFRRGNEAAALVQPYVPQGIEDVLGVFEGAGIVIDSSNNVLLASEMAKQFGLVHGKNLTQDFMVDLVDQVRAQGIPITGDQEMLTEESKERLFLHIRAARVGARFVLILIEDRTAQVRAYKIHKDFIANISHELKTPIGAVTLLGEALYQAAEDPQQVRNFSEHLLKESNRLGRIVQEALDLSRIEDQERIRAYEQVDMNIVTAEALARNTVAAQAQEIRVVYKSDNDAIVLGYQDILVTAIDNLVANAIQYSPDGTHVGVGVRVHNDVVEVSVTDRGEGIAPQYQERIFERFFRVDSARSRATGGTGLGLAIVEHAAQRHQGSVRVWSQVGCGSTFTFSLPKYIGSA